MNWLPGNIGGLKTIRFDTVAGLTAAAVVLPKAMAYATVAGLPVEVGLYTAFLPMMIYALLGTSRVLSVSSTATIAILTASQLGKERLLPNAREAIKQFQSLPDAPVDS